jgi:uncharacterized protein YegP (UPF0339 family)
MAGKFEVYKDKAGKFRFRLKAGNGEIIAVGEAYESKTSAMHGIESIRSNAEAAMLVDLTDQPGPMSGKSSGQMSGQMAGSHAGPAAPSGSAAPAGSAGPAGSAAKPGPSAGAKPKPAPMPKP